MAITMHWYDWDESGTSGNTERPITIAKGTNTLSLKRIPPFERDGELVKNPLYFVITRLDRVIQGARAVYSPLLRGVRGVCWFGGFNNVY